MINYKLLTISLLAGLFVLHAEAAPAPEPSLWERTKHFVSEHKTAIAVTTAVIVATIATYAFINYKDKQFQNIKAATFTDFNNTWNNAHPEERYLAHLSPEAKEWLPLYRQYHGVHERSPEFRILEFSNYFKNISHGGDAKKIAQSFAQRFNERISLAALTGRNTLQQTLQISPEEVQLFNQMNIGKSTEESMATEQPWVQKYIDAHSALPATYQELHNFKITSLGHLFSKFKQHLLSRRSA